MLAQLGADALGASFKGVEVLLGRTGLPLVVIAGGGIGTCACACTCTCT